MAESLSTLWPEVMWEIENVLTNWLIYKQDIEDAASFLLLDGDKLRGEK